METDHQMHQEAVAPTAAPLQEDEAMEHQQVMDRAVDATQPPHNTPVLANGETMEQSNETQPRVTIEPPNGEFPHDATSISTFMIRNPTPHRYGFKVGFLNAMRDGGSNLKILKNLVFVIKMLKNQI